MCAHSVSRDFQKKSAPVWQAVLDHPFVQGIGTGDLSQKRFEHYLKQDYLYLIEFSRVFALAAAKSDALDDMAYFSRLLQTTLDIEMDLHRRSCADFGITAEVLETTEPALVTTAYTNLLVRTCYEGCLADILAVVLPCEVGYVEIARTLEKRGLPSKRHFRDWIETYSSTEFREFADWIGNRFDRLAALSSREDKDRWYRLYLASARFELLFFEMSWTGESWPPLVPR